MISVEQNKVNAGTADILLKSVTRRGKHFVARITDTDDSARQWLVHCKAHNLQTFAAFQKVVANEHSLWISHWCQTPRLAEERREDWQRAVGNAFAAGAKR